MEIKGHRHTVEQSLPEIVSITHTQDKIHIWNQPANDAAQGHREVIVAASSQTNHPKSVRYLLHMHVFFFSNIVFWL